ncbi:anti-sigma factor family protein [Corallococcus exiguus]|uniref:anti-sigma factor family protein n=1 Tax=Corallococcus exiguus TaxID=83462 RepID=UPI001560B56C|nr:zf-HC2 domain-containing protein [Corallococcus exiguus]NRD50025.1 zf-HC2 domain-containing protein [Corallococcus exiguus]
MNAQNAHAHEDRLLDFAYGELPASEAHVLEQHVQGCARCTKALADIRGVRTTMAQLSSEPAPDAGLESLLAYAQQSARRAAAGPEPKPSRWRRFLLPAVGLATVGTFGILTLTVSENLDLAPNLSQRVAPSPTMAAAKQESPTRERNAPSSLAPAPSTATLEVDVPEGASDELAAAPAPDVTKNQVEAKVQRKGTAAARPSDWMNAGSGGAMLERRAEAEAPKKKMSKAVRDADDDFAALSQATAGVAEQEAPPKEEQANDGYLAKDEPAARRSSGKLSDKAMGAKGDSLRLGEAAYGRGLMTEDDDQAVAAGAAPPPPAVASAPVVQAVPVAPSAVGSIGGATPPSAPKPESAQAQAAKPAPMEKSASKAAMTARDLSAQAQAAANQGDRAREAQLLRAALAAGASGSERLALLSRLCESESAQGRTREAAAICGQIINEAPGSSAAQLAQRRMRQASPATAPESAPASAAPSQPAQ